MSGLLRHLAIQAIRSDAGELRPAPLMPEALLSMPARPDRGPGKRGGPEPEPARESAGAMEAGAPEGAPGPVITVPEIPPGPPAERAAGPSIRPAPESPSRQPPEPAIPESAISEPTIPEPASPRRYLETDRENDQVDAAPAAHPAASSAPPPSGVDAGIGPPSSVSSRLATSSFPRTDPTSVPARSTGRSPRPLLPPAEAPAIADGAGELRILRPDTPAGGGGSAESTEIVINIGRVEVSAPPEPARPPKEKRSRPQPMPLEQYLAKRRRGTG